MMPGPGKLIFFCGKMAAGKSTLSKALAEQEHAVRLAQDDWLAQLFPREIRDVAGYVDRAARLNAALTPLLVSLLSRGITVVLDFPGNTRMQRAWFRQLFEAAGAGHELHLIDAPDDLCKRQLRERSADLPAGTPWTTDAEFDTVTSYFQPPTADERFTVIRHERR
jgi:predicted kinase